MELYQIVQLVLAVIVVGLYLYHRITGIDLLKNIIMTKPLIQTLAATAEAVSGIWTNRKELKVVNTIAKAAIEAAEIAERAWKIGNLKREDRNPFAKALVKDTLAKAGIEVTEQVAMIVDGAIEATCLVLPHEKHTEPTQEVEGEIGD